MHRMKRKAGRAFAGKCCSAFLLLSVMLLPGAGMAAEGKIGASQFYSRLAYDVNNRPYRIAEIPASWYNSRPACAGVALNSTPYVASFVGGGGNFGNANIDLVDQDPRPEVNTTNKTRTDYYAGKMMAMANALSANGGCVRVVSIEAPLVADGGYGAFGAYPNYNFFGATMSGSYDVYLPISKGASADFAISLAMQLNTTYSAAPRWYLHGGSGSAMHSARLLDMLNDGAVAAYTYKVPQATILESLPISGDMLEICRNVNPLSDADKIISTSYAGYETANTCSVVRANPSLYNYRIYTAAIRDWYVGAKGKSVYVMMGANDPLWKETLSKTEPAAGGSVYYASPTTTGWASLGLYRNFLATIGVAESSCTNRSTYVFDASHASYIYNTYQKADCGAGGRIKIRQYQHGGHGPLTNYTVGSLPAGEKNPIDQLRAWLW